MKGPVPLLLEWMDNVADTVGFERLHPLAKVIVDDASALLFLRATHSYEIFLRSGDAVSRKHAREGLLLLQERITRTSGLEATEQAIALNRVGGMLRQASEGAEAEIIRAEGVAQGKRLAAALGAAERRVAAVARGKRGGAILQAIDAAMLERADLHHYLRTALELFLRDLPLSDHTSWAMIADKLAGFRRTAAKLEAIQESGASLEMALAAWRKMARGEASGLKGFLQERAFWASAGWHSKSQELVRDAHIRAARLFGRGADVEVRVLTRPLRTYEGGREIYDGAILIIRREGGKTEAILDTVIQIKSEKEISVVRQMERDLGRESKREARFLVQHPDIPTEPLVIRPASDRLDLKRVFVSPELPSRASVERLFAGAKPDFLPTLLDPDQMDEIAYWLLLISAPVTKP